MESICVPCGVSEDAHTPCLLGCSCLHPDTQSFLRAAFQHCGGAKVFKCYLYKYTFYSCVSFCKLCLKIIRNSMCIVICMIQYVWKNIYESRYIPNNM